MEVSDVNEMRFL